MDANDIRKMTMSQYDDLGIRIADYVFVDSRISKKVLEVYNELKDAYRAAFTSIGSNSYAPQGEYDLELNIRKLEEELAAILSANSFLL